ncbi:MAG TPA: hypothetical protein VFN55_17430 [Solirubrobacteraceae bacterium]|nr:hypothetical protein [Solirubrobacteraceae bacterium]
MTFIRRHSRLMLVALSCAALGAGASAIASAGAATHPAGTPAQARGGHALKGPGHEGRRHKGPRGRGLRLARRAVHAQLVVPTKQGFVTVTLDRGTVQSVSGDQLTITEGTPKQTYKTVTLTIPAGAKIRDNRQVAPLSALTHGQRVIVVTAPKRTFVLAHDAKAPRG